MSAIISVNNLSKSYGSHQVLNNVSFSFEGGNLPYTEKKTIEYTGQEIAGVTIYWNVNTALTPGDYTVEIFADNYRLTSRRFSIAK